MEMLKLVPIIFLFFGSFFPLLGMAAEKPFIISGFDDVLRQAENTGIFKAAIKILEKDKTFTGMQELYTAVSQSEEYPKFVVVSAISSWFDGRIENFLTESQFPPHRRYLRNWLTQWSIEDFKIEKIKKVISERPGREFIVIFDNSDASLLLVETVGKSILRQDDVNLIFPAYSFCPSSYDPCAEVTVSVLKICKKVRDHIQSQCQHREQ